MARTAFIFVIFSTLAAMSTNAQTGLNCNAAIVVATSGKVLAQADGGLEEPLFEGDRVCAGTRIETGFDGRITLQLPANDTIIRLNRDTDMYVNALKSEGDVLLNRGILHFLSSTSSYFSVVTRYVTAGIDGTEAVVHAVPSVGAVIVVREGRIRATRETKGILVDAGDIAYASAADPETRLVDAKDVQALPEVFRPYVLNPAGAVDWAIHYPLSALDVAKTLNPEAMNQIGDARFAAAERVLKCNNPDRSRPAALCLLLSIQRDDAKAVEDRLNSPPEVLDSDWHIAASYALQSQGELRAAEAEARMAVASDSNNARVRARLAEILLLRGDPANALELLNAAPPCALVPYVDAIAGFAQLSLNRRAAALQSFTCSIRADGNEPLGWLGRGLARIRAGDISGGRGDLEIAASLDPRQASLRVWLGRAYLNEGRDSKAAAQFELARREDPDNPTTDVFDALRLFDSNEPVAALRRLQEAKRRGKARAPVRDSRGLGEDAAQRSAATAVLYDLLGLDQAAIRSAASAVSADPTASAAHDVLARVLSNRSGYEVARSSERLQAELLAGPTNLPIRPQEGEVNLGLLVGLAPPRPALREFGSFFETDGLAVSAELLGGTQNTVGDTFSASVREEGFSFGIGQFHYESDGFGRNADQLNDILAIQTRASVASNLDIFAEWRWLHAERGDLNQPLLLERQPNRVTSNDQRGRFGFHARLGANTDVLGLLVWRSIDSESETTSSFVSGKETGWQLQLRIDQRPYDTLKLVFGGEFGFSDTDAEVFMRAGNSRILTDVDAREGHQRTLYAYADFTPAHWATIGAGISYDFLMDESSRLTTQKVSQISPKIGGSLKLGGSATIRAAWFKTVKKRLLFDQQLEPTVFLGFNQAFQDLNGAVSESIGIGYDWNPTPGLNLGVEWVRRSIDQGNELEFVKMHENTVRAHGSFSIGPQWTFGVSVERVKQNSPQLDLETLTIPLRVSWFDSSGFFASGGVTYYDQRARSNNVRAHVSGAVVDASIGWRSTGGDTVVTLEALNLTDRKVRFEEPVFRVFDVPKRRFASGISVMGRIAFNF